MDVDFFIFFLLQRGMPLTLLSLTKKTTGTAETEKETHTLITEVYGNSRLGTRNNKTVLDYV